MAIEESKSASKSLQPFRVIEIVDSNRDFLTLHFKGSQGVVGNGSTLSTTD